MCNENDRKSNVIPKKGIGEGNIKKCVFIAEKKSTTKMFASKRKLIKELNLSKQILLLTLKNDDISKEHSV